MFKPRLFRFYSTTPKTKIDHIEITNTPHIPNVIDTNHSIATASQTVPSISISPNSYSNTNKSITLTNERLNKLPIAKHTLHYPWLMSYQGPRIPVPSLWSSIKNHQVLNAGIKRAQNHLQEPAYKFPEDYFSDIKPVIRNLLATLSLDTPLSIKQLEPFMTKSLIHQFLPNHNSILDRGGRIIYSSSKRTLQDLAISPKLTNINFTYGPYPAPEGTVQQPWFSLITLIVDKQDQEFRSYVEQKIIMQKAMDEGCYMRIDTELKVDINLVIYNKLNQCVLSDTRKKIAVQFISPHFCSADEIFTMNKDGSWKLAWDWRISDIDGLVVSNAKDYEKLVGDRNLKIDWRGSQDKDQARINENQVEQTKFIK